MTVPVTLAHTASTPISSPTFLIGEDGWCTAQSQRIPATLNMPDLPELLNVPEVRHEPSPNCDPRPQGISVELLVIHNISLPPGKFNTPFIADLFCNRLNYDADPYFEQLRPLRVSAHFLIRRDGGVVQFVATTQRAWHAGVSSFGARERCNDFSIGIELEGTDYEPFTSPQYVALYALTHALLKRHGLTAVCGHSDIAPGRKTDPGPFFDWVQYQQAVVDRRAQVLTTPRLGFPIEG